MGKEYVVMNANKSNIGEEEIRIERNGVALDHVGQFVSCLSRGTTNRWRNSKEDNANMSITNW